MTQEKMDRRVKSLLDYWPLLVVIGGGITGYLQLKWTVMDLRNDVDILTAKEVPEEHRFTAIEKDIEWLRKGHG